MKCLLTLFCITLLSIAYGQSPMNVKADADQKLVAFIKKSKFEGEAGTSFNGLSNPNLKSDLTKLINQSAKDFLTIVNNHPTEAKFQNEIGQGLTRFNKFYTQLDSEDEDRICSYFEELMDCVGLQSSNGQLNKWRYGFDPGKK